MKRLIILIFFLHSIACLSQDITVIAHVTQELLIKNVEYRLSLFTFKESNSVRDVELLSTDRLLVKLSSLKIAFEKIEPSNLPLMPGVQSSGYRISSNTNEVSLKKLMKFLQDFSNYEFDIYAFDIIDKKKNYKLIYNEALSIAENKAKEMAEQMDRDLGELIHVKLVFDDDGLSYREYNLNKSIGWSDYPGSDVDSFVHEVVKKAKTIEVSKIFEFTYHTN